MAHLWVRNGTREWAALDLVGDLVLDNRVLPVEGSFDVSDEHSSQRSNDRSPDRLGTWLVRSSSDGHEWWALLVRPRRATVNGIPVPNGLRVLLDRDEIHLAGFETAYFSTERLTAIQPCPPSADPLICPRCRQAIGPSAPAVCCPACGVWHHEDPALGCWTYAERCALCPQSTNLDAGYQWTPEEL